MLQGLFYVTIAMLLGRFVNRNVVLTKTVIQFILRWSSTKGWGMVAAVTSNQRQMFASGFIAHSSLEAF